MDIKNIKAVYFVGIGGIGMSALARYFKVMGYEVAGYDRTLSPLTRKMTGEERFEITYEDDENESFRPILLGALAGEAGFEPTREGVKVPCLTAWRHPNMFG